MLIIVENYALFTAVKSSRFCFSWYDSFAMATTVQQTSNAITLKGSVKLITDYLSKLSIHVSLGRELKKISELLIE